MLCIDSNFRIAGGPTMSLNPDPEFEYSPLLDPAKKKYAWWVMEFLTRKEKIRNKIS